MKKAGDLVAHVRRLGIDEQLLGFVGREREVRGVHVALTRSRLDRRADVALDRLVDVGIAHEERILTICPPPRARARTREIRRRILGSMIPSGQNEDFFFDGGLRLGGSSLWKAAKQPLKATTKSKEQDKAVMAKAEETRTNARQSQAFARLFSRAPPLRFVQHPLLEFARHFLRSDRIFAVQAAPAGERAELARVAVEFLGGHWARMT